jgi:hypothetical protein
VYAAGRSLTAGFKRQLEEAVESKDAEMALLKESFNKAKDEIAMLKQKLQQAPTKKAGGAGVAGVASDSDSTSSPAKKAKTGAAQKAATPHHTPPTKHSVNKQSEAKDDQNEPRKQAAAPAGSKMTQAKTTRAPAMQSAGGGGGGGGKAKQGQKPVESCLSCDNDAKRPVWLCDVCQGRFCVACR